MSRGVEISEKRFFGLGGRVGLIILLCLGCGSGCSHLSAGTAGNSKKAAIRENEPAGLVLDSPKQELRAEVATEISEEPDRPVPVAGLLEDRGAKLRLGPTEGEAAGRLGEYEKELEPVPLEKRLPDVPYLQLDPTKIHCLQRQEIAAQSECDTAGPRRQNRFTRWLDGFHERMFCRMDNAVRRVDTMWLREDAVAPYGYELSTFKLRTLTRVGGRGNEKDYEVKVRFSGDVALPGLERKLHLIFDNAGRDSLPGTDPLKQEADTRLGIRTMWRSIRNSELSLGSGLRWRSSSPVVYLDLDWRWKRDVQGGLLRLDPRVFWYSDDGFGQMTSLTWTRQTHERQWLQIRTAERSTEKSNGGEFEQTFRYVWLRSGAGRGWVAQASVFPHLKHSDWLWDNSLINLSWRDALYRKWIYYTVTPQMEFPKENDYNPQFSLRIGLEILFGGRIDNLI